MFKFFQCSLLLSKMPVLLSTLSYSLHTYRGTKDPQFKLSVFEDLSHFSRNNNYIAVLLQQYNSVP